MLAVQIASMLVGVCLLIVLTYKGMNLFLATIISGLVVAVGNGILWSESLFTGYATGFGGFVISNIFTIVIGAIFGQLVTDSGCGEAIAMKIMSITGRKFMLLGLVLTGSLFCYVGINGWVVIFTVAPLGIAMFEKAQIPKRLLPMCTSLGTTCGVGVLAYSPDLNNFIPTQYLGTNLGAGALLSLVAFGVCFTFGMCYVTWRINGYYRTQGIDKRALNAQPLDLTPSRGDLPPWYLAALPILTVAASCIVSTQFLPSGPAVALSLSLGSVVAMAVGFHQRTITLRRGGNLPGVFSEGCDRGVLAMFSASALVGFGAIVQMTPAFQSVVSAILSMDVHPYLSEVVGINILAGLLGSGPAANTLWMQSLAQHYLDMGAPAAVLHRLAPITSLGLNTLPHCAAVVISLSYYKLSYKEAYKGMFFTSVVGPVLAAFATMAVAMVFYPIG